MSLSKPKKRNDPFSLQEWALFSRARYLVQRAIEFKQNTNTGLHDVTALRSLLVNFPVSLSNELMCLIISILKKVKRADCLPLISDPNCKNLRITMERKNIFPELVGMIGGLKGLETLKVELSADWYSAWPDHKYAHQKKPDDQRLLSLAIAMRSLHNLTVINMQVLCTTEILISISATCRLLVDLNIKNSRIDLPEVLRSLKNCRRLEILNLDCIDTSSLIPHVAYLLQNLQYLRSLSKFDIIRLWDYFLVNSIYLTKSFDGEYQLESVFLKYPNYNIDISKVAALLPNLKEIKNNGPFESDVRLLRNIPNLSSLHLTCEHVEDLVSVFADKDSKYEQLSFELIRSINILFQRCNFNYLTKLKLCSCDEIDLETIDKSAPKLKSLTLSDCSSTLIISDENRKGFQKLNTLKIYSAAMSVSEIRFVLSNCNDLRKLCLFEFYVRPLQEEDDDDPLLIDELFSELVDHKKKKCLTFVKLDTVLLSLHTVKYLIDRFESLSYIEVTDLQRQLDPSVERCIISSIKKSLKRDSTRTITLKMRDTANIVKRRAIENDPAAVKSLRYLM